MTFLERTTDARKFRHWEGDVEADYIYTSGVAGERFFVALRDEGRMLASRCAACKLDYLPPRMFCEDCFAELTEYVDVPRAGCWPPDARRASSTISRRACSAKIASRSSPNMSTYRRPGGSPR